MGMTEDDKRNCCLLEIQETEAKYYKTLEDIEKVRAEPCFPQQPWISHMDCAGLVLAPRAGRSEGQDGGKWERRGIHKTLTSSNVQEAKPASFFVIAADENQAENPPAVSPHPGVRISHSWLCQAGFADKSCVCRYLLSL